MTIADPDRKRSAHSDPCQGEVTTPATVFAALASDLATASDLDQVFGMVLEFAATGVHCDWATIELRPTRRYAAITVTSDPRVAQAGVAQPIDDHETNRAGGSVHVVELAGGQTPVGTISFYAAHSNGFSAADTTAAKLLAVHAALAIVAVRNTINLSEAIETRTVIAQAQGIVMEHYGVNGEEAFALLRRCSQHNNLKLRDIAHDVVTSRRLPGDQPRAGHRS